jgi:hypothetical protein
LFNKLANGHLF